MNRSMSDMQAYANIIKNLLTSVNKPECAKTIDDGITSITASFNKLLNYLQYQYIGNPKALKDAYAKSCSANSCAIASQNLLSGVTGDSKDVCDVF